MERTQSSGNNSAETTLEGLAERVLQQVTLEAMKRLWASGNVTRFDLGHRVQQALLDVPTFSRQLVIAEDVEYTPRDVVLETFMLAERTFPGSIRGGESNG